MMRRIQQGVLDPRNLPLEDRRRCVEHLVGEGYAVTEISEILKVCERTIARDKAAIREANALKRDPAFAGQMAGELIRRAEQHMGRILRAARSRDATASVKIEAEQAAWRVGKELVECLQSLGFLPRQARHVTADLRHQVEFPDLDELAAETARVKAIVAEGDGTLIERLEEIEQEVLRGKAVQKLRALEARITEGVEQDGQGQSEQTDRSAHETE